MFNDISCDGKGNEEECVANAKVVSILAKKFGIGQWSFVGPGSEKKWYSMEENSPQGIWDHIADKMLLEFAESGCPIHCPGVISKTKETENCRYILRIVQQLRPFFASLFLPISSVFTEQLQTCVKNVRCIDGTINCSQ